MWQQSYHKFAFPSVSQRTHSYHRAWQLQQIVLFCFLFSSPIKCRMLTFHLKGALHSFSLVYLNRWHHSSWALGPLLSKIRASWMKALQYLARQLIRSHRWLLGGWRGGAQDRYRIHGPEKGGARRQETSSCYQNYASLKLQNCFWNFSLNSLRLQFTTESETFTMRRDHCAHY